MLELLSDECIDAEFVDDTALVHLLPREDCCTTALVNFLVMSHNQFVDICLKLTREMHTLSRTWLVNAMLCKYFIFVCVMEGNLSEEIEWWI